VSLLQAFVVDPKIDNQLLTSIVHPNGFIRGSNGKYDIHIMNANNVDVDMVVMTVIVPATQKIKIETSDFFGHPIPNPIYTLLTHPMAGRKVGEVAILSAFAKNVHPGQSLNAAIHFFKVSSPVNELPVLVTINGMSTSNFILQDFIRMYQVRDSLLSLPPGTLSPEILRLIESDSSLTSFILGFYETGLVGDSLIRIPTLPLEYDPIYAGGNSELFSQKKTFGITNERQVAACNDFLLYLIDLFNAGIYTERIIQDIDKIMKGVATVETPYGWAALTLGFAGLVYDGYEIVCPKLDDCSHKINGLGEILFWSKSILSLIDGGLWTEKGAMVGVGVAAHFLKINREMICNLLFRPWDPNMIVGPSGNDMAGWITRAQKLRYNVHFENDSTLSIAPARTIIITQQLDSTINPSSFRLGSFGFGSFTFNPPENRSYYQQRLDVRDSLGVFVDVAAGLDVTTNKIFWSFRSIDPATGEPPTDPLRGFLPVNDSLNHGQGFVSYTVEPKSTTKTGDIVHAKASIIFDYNDPVETNEWLNAIDAIVPVSHVKPTVIAVDTSSLRVCWSGYDDSTGSSIRDYSLYVAIDTGAYSLFSSGLTDTSTIYPALLGHTHKFFTIARDNAGNIESMKTSAEATFYFEGFTTQIVAAEGWNLLSLPVSVTDPRKEFLFPTSVSDAFIYDGSYLTQDSIMFGSGFWLKFSSQNNIPVIGIPKDLDTLDLAQGWNMIGCISYPVPTSSITTIPTGIINSSYFEYDGIYKEVDTLKPGKGYWIKVSQLGKLILDHNLATNKISTHSNSLTDYNYLTIQDGYGKKQFLYFGISRDDMNKSFFELPPVPPSGCFDVRFPSQSMLEVINTSRSKEIPIVISSAKYPLTVTWDIKSTDIYSVLKIDGKEITLKGNSKIQVHGDKSKIVLSLIDASHLPKQFSLEQNYPNPFNPVTTIQYALPVDAKVTMTIYNILGQRVLTLADEIQSAGYKSVAWNGSDVASGVYLYRIEAISVTDKHKSFTQVRKMLLLK
jgi:hypothetical protein